MKIDNFFAELKRRNVYKIAVAYAVVGWLLIQIATQVFPFFDVPNWAVRLVVLVLALGFPIALVLSWAFEITPEGIKREADVSESTTPRRGRKLVGSTIALAVIAASMFCFQILKPRLMNDSAAKPKESSPSADAIIPQKSIAVLPFDNLSRDPDNAYFAEGVQDEILTRLAHVADLKVISRTSTEKYKSAPDNLRDIAQKLGVAHILEGSVQKAGNEVRISVQLINALGDTQLWAETYDRKLIDIFGVESEVAQTIASYLEAKLTGSEKRAIARRPTENTEAYQLYLKGRFFWNKRTGDDLKTARDYFEQATKIDPNYSEAYAALAETYALMSGFAAASPRESFPQAKAAAERAIALDQTSSSAHCALGLILNNSEMNFARSEQEYRKAIALDPNNATAHHWFGNTVLLTLGRFDEAMTEAKKAIELDPLSLIINADLGNDLIFARRYDEAIAQLRKTLALDGNFAYALWNLGEALVLKGDVKAGIVELEKARALDSDPQMLGLLGYAYARVGRMQEAKEMLRQLNEASKRQFVRRYLPAIVEIGLGEKGKAIDDLEQSYESDQGVDIAWIKVDPLFDPLRDEPRFQALVAKVFSHDAR
ncbi:MAG: tetratricopeptide repeat protein [Verrucomicrobiota bacterium]|nr:tetratricopeptide repeat protein [Verrucomicrobiota bacterium]